MVGIATPSAGGCTQPLSYEKRKKQNDKYGEKKEKSKAKVIIGHEIKAEERAGILPYWPSFLVILFSLRFLPLISNSADIRSHSTGHDIYPVGRLHHYSSGRAACLPFHGVDARVHTAGTRVLIVGRGLSHLVIAKHYP